mmetsp:Transcript_5410/g.6271  ORF Transcript_5410/g.6271 Transcript_5410/m.6271 type:complete len:230 (+) Transcript_5410:43-732(+)
MSFDNEANDLKDCINSAANNNRITNTDFVEEEDTMTSTRSNHSNDSASFSESETDDDDYFLSDDEELNNINSNPNDGEARLNYSASMADHIAYLSNSLTYALDSLQLDKSLVLQAQLSGQLNNEKQRIIDKRKEILRKIENLKQLYDYNFGSANSHALKSSVSRVEKLKQDITEIEYRIDKLKSGPSKSNGSTFRAMFKSKNQNIGVANNYPIEYNQAKDKVLERQFEE